MKHRVSFQKNCEGITLDGNHGTGQEYVFILAVRSKEKGRMMTEFGQI